ncbi:MAG: hypothetical protein HOO86_03710 [Bacteroidales bacterium]|nr:hypothetical protein [Bacteroidales bacterium]
MDKTAKTHYLRHDYRAVSLDLTIRGLSETITVLKNQVNEIYWYDRDFFLDESEPIYGLAFIAFQNYINGSIKDFCDSLKEKETYYKIELHQNSNEKSKIELIIGLANYIKHKEEGVTYKGTKEILDYFKLDYENVFYLDSSPIFQGLTLLNEDWDLFKIKDYVTEWREFIWSRND